MAERGNSDFGLDAQRVAVNVECRHFNVAPREACASKSGDTNGSIPCT